MNISGATKVECDRYYSLLNNASCLTDSRFAVINGLLFELSTVEAEDGSFAVLVGCFDAEEVYNPSHAEDLMRAYGNYVVSFGFIVPAEVVSDNGKCIQAENLGEALLVSLITTALHDCNNLKKRLREIEGEEQ